jgi:hypothetical protein
MKLELSIMATALVSFALLKLATLWFIEDEFRRNKMLRLARGGLKAIALGFVLWGLYIIFNAFGQADRLEMFVIIGYGAIQFGFAAFLAGFPRILKRGSLVDALGDAVNRNS